MAKNNESGRKPMSRKEKTLRQMAKEADYYASMGGRGPRKGSKQYQARIDYLKGGMAAAKKESRAQRSEAKAERARPPRKKAAVAKKGAPARRPKASKSLY